MNSVSSRTRLGLDILGVALVAGVAGDALLRATPWGLNALLCTGILVGGVVWLVHRHTLRPGPDAGWLGITALLLAAAFLRRDAAVLMRLDILALFITLCVAAASLQGERVRTWSLVDYLRTGVTATAGSIAGGILLLGRDVQWREFPRTDRLRTARAVLLGVVIAAPLLVIFAALFASADQVFGNVLGNLFAFDVTSVVSHTVLFCFWAAITAGYLRWSLLGRPIALPTAVEGGNVRLGLVPLTTALGLLIALFLLFDVVQLRYFFGGAALVQSTTGLTYAEYARQGFFQLVAASALVLPVLLGADFLTRGGPTALVHSFRRLAIVLLALLAVIMASALGRMRLYVDAFGLSEVRLYATAFMILLLGVFAWFAWTVLRGMRQRFGFGVLMQGLGVLAALHVMNPDAFIARTNLNRLHSSAERPFDAAYALSLSADAVPNLLDELPRLAAPDQRVLACGLVKRWNSDTVDWRTWNLSRAHARALITHNAATLRQRCAAAIRELHNGH
jgi:hypothetical protein